MPRAPLRTSRRKVLRGVGPGAGVLAAGGWLAGEAVAGTAVASGWMMAGFNATFGVSQNYRKADHQHGPATTEPLLVLDMYEHSHRLDDGAAAARYVDAFFANLDWERVAQRLDTLG